MKKRIAISFISSLSLIFVAGGILFANKPIMYVAKAEASEEYVFEEEKDLSKEARDDDLRYNLWRAVDGLFPSIDNWFYSGKGFSFEFKFQNPDSKKPMVAYLKNGDTNLTSAPASTYIFKFSGDNFTRDSTTVGSVTALEEGWYRYDVMLSEFGNSVASDETAHMTLNGIQFAAWGDDYWNDLSVRKMKIINEAPEVDVSGILSNSKKYLQARDGSRASVPVYKNFFTSEKGFYINYYTENRSHLALGNDKGQEATGRFYADSKGKHVSLGNNWYHWEIMVSDAGVNENGTANPNLDGFWFPWAGTYFFGKTKGFGIIDNYSKTVTYHVDGSTNIEFVYDEYLSKPADPVKDGYHFVGWYTDSEFNTEYDFNEQLTDDVELYAFFAPGLTHTFDQEIIRDDLLKEEATCVHGDLYYLSCACGAKGEDTFEVGEPNPNNHLHVEEKIVDFIPQTCDDDGSYTNQTICLDCHEVISSTINILEKTGHSYSLSSCVLSEDRLSGVFTFVCMIDSDHKAEVPAVINKTVIEPSKDKEGKEIYTLTCEFNGENYSRVFDFAIPVKEDEEPTNNNNGTNNYFIFIYVGASVLAISGMVVAFILIRRKMKTK